MNRGLEPITPPEPTARLRGTFDSAETRRFRVQFWRLVIDTQFRVTAVLILGLPLLLILPTQGARIVWLLNLFIWLILSLIFTFVDGLLRETRVNPTGIRIGPFIQPVEIQWQHLILVRSIRLPFFRYLRLKNNMNGRNPLLPLFHIDQRAFEDAVIQLAPPGNPLRSYFEAQRRAP
jgi:hypothetical protein